MSEEQESFDDLLGELSRLKPRQPSSELHQRIGAQLNASPAGAGLLRRHYVRWGLLAAACSVVVGLSIWLLNRKGEPQQPDGQGIVNITPHKKDPGPKPQLVQIAAGWRIEPTGDAEYLVLNQNSIQLDRGELLVEAVPMAKGEQARPPLSIETLAGKVTTDDTKSYIGTHLLESAAALKPKGSAMTSLTRVLVLAGAVTLANAQGSVTGQANQLLAAEPDKVPVNYAVAANSDFALDLYQQLAKEHPGKNLFFSPFSISSALAMAAEGARGETAAQMGKALRFPAAARRIGDDAQLIPWNTALIHTGMSTLNERFNARKPVAKELLDKIERLQAELKKANEIEDSKADVDLRLDATRQARALEKELKPLLEQINQYELRVANALWGEKTYPFQQAYLGTIHKFYNTGGLFPVDFLNHPEAARKQINAWVEEQTHDRIKDLIPPGSIDDQTRLVLTNAVYFMGNWAEPFRRDRTQDGDFAVSADQKVKVSLMSQGKDHPYMENDSLQALELPYKGNELSMLVLLPKGKTSLDNLEKSLSAKMLTDLRAKLRSQKVDVDLPRFKLETSFTLNETLATLGMKISFSPDADFSGMTGKRDFYISTVIHKAFVNVNEEGTEAAAATAVVFPLAEEINNPPAFRADHPFVFAICDKRDGSILFLGRITDPSKEE